MRQDGVALQEAPPDRVQDLVTKTCMELALRPLPLVATQAHGCCVGLEREVIRRGGSNGRSCHKPRVLDHAVLTLARGGAGEYVQVAISASIAMGSLLVPAPSTTLLYSTLADARSPPL